MILAVQLKGPTPETNRTLEFSASPVRIGRNQLNDIPLDDPFVSEWHGIIRFTATDVAYFDLGSTNGSILDGERLQKNVPAVLTTASRLQLGRIELSVSPPRPVAAPQPIAPPQPSPEAGGSKTIGWGQEFFRPGAAATPPPAGSVSGPSARFGAVTPPPAQATSGMSWEGVVTPPPPGAGPRSWEGVVTPPPPGVAKPAPGTAPSAAAPAAAIGAADAALLARHKKLLETFCEAFVGLRKGYEQFGAEVGVRTISGRTPLHRARTTREVVDYLTEPGVDLTSAMRDLIAIFADFGIHHIAMMEAVTEGVRSLLQSLTPPEKKSQWKEYTERFDQVVNDDQELHDGIFGAEFARAYASVAVGEAAKPSDDRGGKPGKGRG